MHFVKQHWRKTKLKIYSWKDPLSLLKGGLRLKMYLMLGFIGPVVVWSDNGEMIRVYSVICNMKIVSTAGEIRRGEKISNSSWAYLCVLCPTRKLELGVSNIGVITDTTVYLYITEERKWNGKG